MKLTKAQKNVIEDIKDEEGEENIRFYEPNERGLVKYVFVSEDRKGDTYYIYPDGDVES